VLPLHRLRPAPGKTGLYPFDFFLAALLIPGEKLGQQWSELQSLAGMISKGGAAQDQIIQVHNSLLRNDGPQIFLPS
jgi:hypothetical protein